MNDLPLIPTPLSTRLRELRVRSLPVAVFTVVLIALAFLWHKYGPTGGGMTGVAEGIRSTVTSLPGCGLVTVERIPSATPDRSACAIGFTSVSCAIGANAPRTVRRPAERDELRARAD